MNSKQILILQGDGIGKEVCQQAIQVLKTIEKKFNFHITLNYGLIGGIAYDETGSPLPNETVQIAKQSDAVLLGAVGGPKWEALDYAFRPERGLLGIRSELELFANLRPAVIYGDLVDASSLKKELVENANIMVIRELTGGIYFGKPKGVHQENGKRVGINTMKYNEDEIYRIGKVAFETALLRDKKLCSVDKANVLETTELWREIITDLGKKYSEVKVNHMYVDNATMQLIRNPKQFDSIVTGNLFGDILSDAAAMITGSIGMLPSASIGEQYALYEPVHGSAPDIAGQDIANPLATILSVGMMFQYSFKRSDINQIIEKAVVQTIQKYRTPDIWVEGKKKVGCTEIGERVIEALETEV